MKTIKPMRVGVMVRPYELARRLSGVLTAYVAFRLDEPQHLLTDMELWMAVAEQLGEGAIFDEGLAKVSGEVLVAGHVYPQNPPQAASFARVLLKRADGSAAFDKRVAAFGDREWRSGVPTEPKPFEKMPLVWERAFGGEGYEKNPKGRGAPKSAAAHLLPNLEDPARLIRSPSDQPQPKSFLPLDPTWPQRLTKQGKNYDDRWMRELSPGPADDLDPTFYHQADDDQRLEGFLEGGERFVLENLHPEQSRIEGELPRVRARAFVSKRPAGLHRPRRGVQAVAGSLEEVPLRLETVWFFPDANMGVLVHRGTTPVRDDDLADLEFALFALEDPRRARDLAHYTSVFEARLDKDLGALEAIDDEPLLPPADLGWAVSFPNFELGEKLEPEGHLRRNVKQRGTDERTALRQKLSDMGLDPDDYGGKEPAPEEPIPTMAEPRKVADHVKKLLEQSKEDQAKREAATRETEAEIRKLELEAQKTAAEAGFEMPSRDDMPPRLVGPPKMEARRTIESALEAAVASSGGAVSLDELRAQVTDERTLAMFDKLEKRFLDLYRKSAHVMPEGRLPPEEDIARLRTQVQIARDAGESLAGADLSGADLRGLDLSGVDLRRALLEGAKLTGAHLERANLDEAVLAWADLSEAKLDGASLRATNLGSAKLRGTSLERVDATDALFMRARLEGVSLRGAKLDNVQLIEAVIADVDFSESRGTGVFFMKLQLPKAKFAGCRLQKAIFHESNLDGADFEGAVMPLMHVFASTARGVRARGASFHKMFVGHGSNLDDACFDEADLTRSSLRTTSLSRASFRKATLLGADLSECDLDHAVFDGANARGAMLVRASLRGAQLRGANLLEAILAKADLAECDLTRANLFRSDMSRVHLSGGTKIDGALLDYARVHPQRAKEQA